MNKNSKKIKKKKKNKFPWKLFTGFVIFEIIFTIATAPIIAYYGPFKNVTTTLVGSAMTTLSHQWIATSFLSQERIDSILGSHGAESVKQDLSSNDIKLPKKHDENIERQDIHVPGKFKGYMLIVHDPTRVKVGYTSKLYTEGQLTSEMARDKDAVAAINGGSFEDTNGGKKWTGTGANPKGLILADGKIIHNDLVEGEEREMVALTKEGKLLVGPYSVAELKKLGATEAVSFGPALIVNGKKVDVEAWGNAPRTAIGQREDGAILMLVTEGRNITGLGATLEDIQDVMLKEYGAVNATNLDGGSSSTMYYEDEVINTPSDSTGERTGASCMYVK
ncbi:phosphodiester glycosidase family protein [Clostridium algidicarnis]|uniref:phosphodiester glycosidase family protein n=1 Tax=Clostridium algidicarnis TaxID=37659 RepID=UPI001C0E6335|nr:phosphodiester glycosidase family protein [Clostridium algidicarnis]MBU3208141.1 phosphodiester glycosidase family protein [Clostridium algidicarnis]